MAAWLSRRAPHSSEHPPRVQGGNRGRGQAWLRRRGAAAAAVALPDAWPSVPASSRVTVDSQGAAGAGDRWLKVRASTLAGTRSRERGTQAGPSDWALVPRHRAGRKPGPQLQGADGGSQGPGEAVGRWVFGHRAVRCETSEPLVPPYPILSPKVLGSAPGFSLQDPNTEHPRLPPPAEPSPVLCLRVAGMVPS